MPLTHDEYVAMLPGILANRIEELNARFADVLPPGTRFAWEPAVTDEAA